jgi:hypothetical protein
MSPVLPLDTFQLPYPIPDAGLFGGQG